MKFANILKIAAFSFVILTIAIAVGQSSPDLKSARNENGGEFLENHAPPRPVHLGEQDRVYRTPQEYVDELNREYVVANHRDDFDRCAFQREEPRGSRHEMLRDGEFGKDRPGPGEMRRERGERAPREYDRYAFHHEKRGGPRPEFGSRHEMLRDGEFGKDRFHPGNSRRDVKFERRFPEDRPPVPRECPFCGEGPMSPPPANPPAAPPDADEDFEKMEEDSAAEGTPMFDVQQIV